MRRVLPILFNTDMVQAILDGEKTTTRRILKLPKHIKKQENGLYTLFAEGTCYEDQHLKEIVNYIKPPYKKGDILYVRETWNFVYNMGDDDRIIEDTGRYIYYADDPMPFSHWVDSNTGEHKDKMPWRPSIHMPKRAARIWLKVTDVRVERLHDMTLDDFLSKGVVIRPEAFNDPENAYMQARSEFAGIWNSTLKKKDLALYGWDANPGVFVIESERCEKPESEG